MSKFGSPVTFLKRLVEDDSAPCAARVLALKQIDHPPLCLLRRLLVKTARTKPVPSRLLALAALKYAREVAFRKLRPVKKTAQADNRPGGNALGI
jgi:hypothetical protein